MAENRIDRELQTREKTVRRKSWQRPETLPSPTPEDGYSYRWIRVSTQGNTDATNVSSKLREGWEPVRADEYPDHAYPMVDEGKYQGVIGSGGLILCRMPIETVDERTEYYRDQTRNQMKAVDENLMREQHSSMPIENNRSSRVTFGGKE